LADGYRAVGWRCKAKAGDNQGLNVKDDLGGTHANKRGFRSEISNWIKQKTAEYTDVRRYVSSKRPFISTSALGLGNTSFCARLLI
jgi:hypothetical protein